LIATKFHRYVSIKYNGSHITALHWRDKWKCSWDRRRGQYIQITHRTIV
jgi:hypothetical protein